MYLNAVLNIYGGTGRNKIILFPYRFLKPKRKGTNKMELNELFMKAMEQKKIEGVKEQTIYCYYSLYKNNVKNTEVATMDIAKIKTLNLQEIINNMLAAGKKRTTIENAKKMLNTVFNYGVFAEYISYNPAARLRIGRNEEKPPVRKFTVYELNAFFNTLASDDRNCIQAYNLFMILLSTGLRIREALALNESDVDLMNKTIRVNKAINKFNKMDTTKTTGSTAILPLNNTAIHFFKAQINNLNQYNYYNKGRSEKYNGSNFVFIDFNTGKRLHYHTAFRIFNKTKAKAGINASLTPHSFRHTYASMLFNVDNINVYQVTKLLRHSDISTTVKYYTETTAEDLRATNNIIDNIINI